MKFCSTPVRILIVLSVLVSFAYGEREESDWIRGEITQKRDADYLIITHNEFATHLTPLIQLRDSLGLSVSVVEDTAIYNVYPGDSCDAIKSYISWAYSNWNPPPSFILLVGDAVEGGGVGDYLPSKIFPKFSYYYAGGLQTHCSDNWYVELDGDDYVPEIPIGRLPVRSNQELDILIQKIIDYEHSEDILDTVMIVIAEEYVGFNGPAFDSIPAECNPIKLYGSEITRDSCHTAIINTYHTGCDVIFSLCHGCYPVCPSHTWSGRFGGLDWQIVFSDTDFAQLPSYTVPPILFEWG